MTPWYLGNSFQVQHMWEDSLWFGPGVIVPLAVWSAIWTGLALWHAAKREEKGWFIFFLLVHTAGILELIYLLFKVRILSADSSPKKRRR
jgi:methionyl-tRNA synthetase